MSNKEKRARELFRSGYNCAQSVFCAFCEETGMKFEDALKLSSSFGGGMGRLREVCGAVSAMFMIAGIVYLRCKTRDINTLTGIASVMPRLFGFAVLIVLASIGIPAFAPFISEVLTVIGAMNSDLSDVMKMCAVFALPVLILSSCYMLKFLHNGFFGETAYEKVNDITVHEFLVLASVLAGLVIFGLFPDTILSMLK